MTRPAPPEPFESSPPGLGSATKQSNRHSRRCWQVAIVSLALVFAGRSEAQRSAESHASEYPGSERIAFLLINGAIVDTSGGILAFPGVAPGDLRLVVGHRNYASVMSADTLDLSDGFGSWDFTTSMSQAYSNGGAPMKQLPDGRFGMFACDASVDGEISAPDFNLWNANTSAGASSQVPE